MPLSSDAGHAHHDATPITGIIWRRVKPECEAAFEALARGIIAAARTFDGYLGTDVYPPVPGVQDAYIILYRYESADHLRRWLHSPERKELLDRLEPMLAAPPFEFYLAHRRQPAGVISTVFAYQVKPDCLEAFADWRRRIHAAVRQQPGFFGTESLDTFGEKSSEFLAIVRFDSREHLDAWLASPERIRFMEEVRHYVTDYRIRRIGTGFEGWFDYSPAGSNTPPAPWRQGLMILGALFPLIMLLRNLLHPVFLVLPVALAFLVLLAIDVALLTWVIMPHFSRLMDFWLRPKPGHTWRTEAAGFGILAVLIGGTLTLALIFGAS